MLRGTLRFFDREHDSGEKTILGSKGPWNASDVLRIVLDQPAAPWNLVRRLYRWFVSEVDEPADALLDPLVKTLAADYHVGNVVEIRACARILFFSPAAYRRRIKTPVDHALGIIKGIGGIVPTIPLGQDLAEQGQDLYQPPTVARWSAAPIGSTQRVPASPRQSAQAPFRELTVLWRQAASGPGGGNVLAAVPPPSRAPSCSPIYFVQNDLDDETREGPAAIGAVASREKATGVWLREFVVRVVTLPEFQLS